METPISTAGDTAKPQSGNLFRIGPRWTLLALVIGAAIAGLLMIQFENLNLLGLSILVFFFIIGIGFKRSWAIYLLFVTLMFLKFNDVEPQDSFALRTLTWPDVMFAMIAIVFAGLCFRYIELSRVVSAFYPGLIKSKSRTVEQNDSGQSTFLFPSLFGGRWWLIPIAIGLSIKLLQVFPYDEVSPRQWITVSGRRIIYLTFVLFIIWFVFRSLVTVILRWNLEPEQASIQARSLVAKEFWGEMYPVERRRVKIRNRTRVD